MSNQPPLILPDPYNQLLTDLRDRLRKGQVKAVVAVSQELVLLYWQIGRDKSVHSRK